MRQRIDKIADKQPDFKTRLLFSVLTATGLSFVFFMSGFLDLYFTNAGMFPFTFTSLFLATTLVFVIVAAALSVIFVAIKGTAFKIIISLGTGLLLTAYIQIAFLNGRLSSMTGESPAWGMGEDVLNIVIWIVMLCLPLLLYKIKPMAWKVLVFALPPLLIIMLIAPLILGFVNLDRKNLTVQSKYVSYKNAFNLSSEENIVVIILDSLDTKYVDEVISNDADFFKPLDGFTRFSDATSPYLRTFASVGYLFSGETHLFDRQGEEYLDEIWNEKTYMYDIKNAGFSTNLYLSNYYAYSSLDAFEKVSNNISLQTPRVKYGSMILEMSRLSAIRFAPLIAKRGLDISKVYLHKTVDYNDGDFDKFDIVNSEGDIEFYEKLKSEKINIEQTNPAFVTYHLNGSHVPISMNENLEIVEKNSVYAYQQTMGTFKILYEYVDQMKKLGIYEKSTIIVTGDHGMPRSLMSEDPTDAIVTTYFIKPKGSSGTPLETSTAPVSHDNLAATIISAAGLEKNEKFGKTVWQVDENETVIRRFFYKSLENFPYIKEYEIVGDARDLDNWKQTETHEIEYQYAP